VLPTDLSGWLLIGDTDESLLTGDESDEMLFPSDVGIGGPRDEVWLKRRPAWNASVWYLLLVGGGFLIEVGGFDAVFFSEFDGREVEAALEGVFDDFGEPDVATFLFDEPEAATGFLDTIDDFKEPDVVTLFIDEPEAATGFLDGVDGAVKPEIFLFSCRSCGRGGNDGSLRTERLRGASAGPEKFAGVGLAGGTVSTWLYFVLSGFPGSGSSGGELGAG
jgi:hypothetical protein